jgi:hypothetical protein
MEGSDMLSDQFPFMKSKVERFSIQSNTTIKKLIEYVERIFCNCPAFPPDVTREDAITEKLVEHLNLDETSPFYFSPQHNPFKKSGDKPDVGVCISSSRIYFFHFEAKFIQTDYVYGDTGGIERFIRERHGVEEDEQGKFRHLKTNGIWGYVINDSFTNSAKKINAWLSKRCTTDKSLPWSQATHLQNIKYTKRTAKFTSTCVTISGKTVTLYHILFELTPS